MNTTRSNKTTPTCLIKAARKCGRDWASQVERPAPAWCELTEHDIYWIKSNHPRAWAKMIDGQGDLRDLEDAAKEAYEKAVA